MILRQYVICPCAVLAVSMTVGVQRLILEADEGTRLLQGRPAFSRKISCVQRIEIYDFLVLDRFSNQGHRGQGLAGMVPEFDGCCT